jgi:hypothetical protein
MVNRRVDRNDFSPDGRRAWIASMEPELTGRTTLEKYDADVQELEAAEKDTWRSLCVVNYMENVLGAVLRENVGARIQTYAEETLTIELERAVALWQKRIQAESLIRGRVARRGEMIRIAHEPVPTLSDYGLDDDWAGLSPIDRKR